VRISYLARGHGFGHAARDHRIINAIRSLAPGIDITVASSGTGHQYFRSRGVECADMGFDDAVDQSPEASWKIWRQLYRSPAADLVVSDEVLPAIPFCAKVLEVPCVLITDWSFGDFGRPEMDRILDDAAEVVMVDFPESHPEPLQTTVRVCHVGPLVDDFVPAEPSIAGAPGSLTVVASFGGVPGRPGARAMLARTLSAWKRHASPGDRLFVFVPRPPSDDGGHAIPGVHWVGITAEPDRYYLAADVVLTDGLAFTACELIFNGIPTVSFVTEQGAAANASSFSRRAEFLDRIGATRTVRDQDDPDTLWDAIVTAAAKRGSFRPEAMTWARPAETAALLLKHLPA
jgi:hypothetical protein